MAASMSRRLPRCGPVRSPQENMLAVLDALDVEPSTIRELARRTGLPLASVHRIVVRLVAWGASRAGARRRPARAAAVRARPARARARAAARDRAAVHGRPVRGDARGRLARRAGRDRHGLDRAARPAAWRRRSRRASADGCPRTSPRRARCCSRSRRESSTRACRLERHGPGTITDPERAARRVGARARARRSRSTARSPGRGVLGVAAPVSRATARVVAALALAVARRSRSSPEAMAPAVRTAALSLGRALSR